MIQAGVSWAGVALQPPGSSDLAAVAKAEQLLEDEAASDADYRDILTHWRAFRDDTFRWFGTAELAYSGFAWD